MKIKTCPRCNGSGTIPDDVAMGQSFRDRRIDKGLKIREVAKSMRKSIGYLCDLEHGRRTWTIEMQNDYNKALEG